MDATPIKTKFEEMEPRGTLLRLFDDDELIHQRASADVLEPHLRIAHRDAPLSETCHADGSLPPSGQVFISMVWAIESADSLTVYQPGASSISNDVS